MSNKKILLVEGEVDGYFIHSLLKAHNLLWLGIEVEPKGGVNNLRRSLLNSDYIEDIRDGHINRFGIVADADSLAQDQKAGFNGRWSKFIEDLTPTMNDLGMTIPTIKSLNGEVFYKADDSKADVRIGLWLMPNHKQDGCLEDFVLESTNLDLPLLPGHPKNQRMLKQYADGCWQALDRENLKSFKDYHHSKASAYTWLAWQTKPTQFLSGVIEAGLLDLDKPDSYVRAFKDWIERCFK